MTSDDTDLLEPDLEERLRRGLQLLAEQTPAQVRRPSWLPAAAAVVVLTGAGLGVGFAVTGHGGQTPRHQAGSTAPPIPSTPPTSPSVIGQGVHYDLARLVAESPRIVIGTVTNVTHGEASDASGGLPYVLADIAVDRALRGPASSSVVAFDYDYGATLSADAPQGASFTTGERVLVFLSSAAGTVHAELSPPHWQVTGGAAGAYPMRGDEPDAPFTLEQVQQQMVFAFAR